MLTGDREEFDKQLAILCAGWDRPVTESRATAYWSGLGKMNLVDFSRVVEHCLGERAPEKFPTVHACWELSRMLKPQRALGALAYRSIEPEDLWLTRANLHLLRHLRTINSAQPWRYGGRTDPEHVMRARLQPLIDARNTWALDMRECAESRDDPAYQKRLWDELVEAAEKRIDAMIAGSAELELA